MVGVGAFGRNHARVFRELAGEQPLQLVAVVDGDSARAASAAAEFGTRAYTSVEAMLAAEKPDAAVVAVPTIAHLEVARHLMCAGVDVLIEKPLAVNLEQADELIAVAKQHGRVAQVGHLERFNPAVRATLPLITTPMFFEVHRLSVFTPRSLDVDVVLDLMIHDLDVVLSLVKSEVRDLHAAGLPVLSPNVDIANVRIEFETGCIANLTASRVSTERVRKLRFFQPYQYISVDYSRRDIFSLTVKPSDSGFPEVVPSKPQVVPEEPLKSELKSFVHAVRERAIPEVPLADGRRALALALEIQRQIAEHSERAHLRELMSRPLANR